MNNPQIATFDSIDLNVIQPSPEIYTDLTKPLPFDAMRDAFSLQEGEKIMVFSDMHYGVKGREYISGRGRPHYTEKDMNQMVVRAINKADRVAFVGDDFEMVYHQFANKDDAIKHYATIIDGWIEAVQNKSEAGKGECKLHIVLGNHDDDPDLFAMLQEKAVQNPEIFYLHPVAVRLGNSLLTHGDLPLRQPHYEDMTPEERQLGREEFMGKNVAKHFPAMPISFAKGIATCVNAKVHFIIQRMVELFRNPSEAINVLYDGLKDSKMLAEMRSSDGVWLPNATDVVTGHTHYPYISKSASVNEKDHAQQIMFHNTGSPVEIKRFLPIEIIAAKNQTVEVKPLLLNEIQSESLQQKTLKMKALPLYEIC